MFKRNRRQKDIVHRWEGNPIIGLEDLDFPCADIRSAGVVLRGEETLLLVTIEHLAGYQSIHLARGSSKGSLQIAGEAFLGACRSDEGCSPHESHGIMDARVTLMENVYYIMYVARGQHGVRLGLASTTDFTDVKRMGYISEPDTKAGALFPEKIAGRYARLERPASGSSIWISYSDDLAYWGGSKLLLSPRPGYWDSSRIGAGPPPVRIPQGWLLIYYGVRETNSGSLFRLGAVILDSQDPVKVIGRSNAPILSPREDYERIGDLSNLVFSTGALLKDNQLDIFYSGANSCLCLGTTSLDDVVETCMRSKEEF